MRKKYTRPTLRKTGKVETVTLVNGSPGGAVDPDVVKN